MNLRKTVASRLKRLRERSGWTQSSLGARCGLEASAIAHFECGRRIPTAKNLIILADAFGTSTDYILGRVAK